MENFNNQKNKISFCTVCMNRSHHIKQTLPKNIKDNINYENVEFVLINYNSTDDLDEWVKKEMKQFIESGILIYYKTTEPEKFHVSHSRNVAARCATGDILCTVDADNFIGKGFANYINDKFNNDSNIFLTCDLVKSCLGRTCFKKTDFHKITGYDEKMSEYGFEDFDLKNRLETISLKKTQIINKMFLEAIPHEDLERIENYKIFSEIEEVFVKKINHYSSLIIYLFKNYTFLVGITISNRSLNSISVQNLFFKKSEYDSSILNNTWEKGKWKKDHNALLLEQAPLIENNKIVFMDKEKKSSSYIDINDIEGIFKVKSAKMILESIMFLSEITNRNKMTENKELKNIIVNDNSYGKANLIKNFSQKIILN